MWTLVFTHKFLISFWKLETFLKDWIKEDIIDIQRNADIVEISDNIEIIDEYDGTTVVPEHMVNYVIEHDDEKVYIISINDEGIKQKLNNYR